MQYFSIVAFNYVERLLQRAIEDVRRLPLEVLSDPSLAGKLDVIAENYKPEYLILGDPTGAVRTANPPRTDSFTGHTFHTSKLSVTIPFTGDARLLEVSPSNTSIPDLPCEITGHGFVVTVSDDENAKTRIDRFVHQMRENFRCMKIDFERELPRLRKMLDQAAEMRRRELERNKANAERLGFPIREAT